MGNRWDSELAKTIDTRSAEIARSRAVLDVVLTLSPSTTHEIITALASDLRTLADLLVAISLEARTRKHPWAADAYAALRTHPDLPDLARTILVL